MPVDIIYAGAAIQQSGHVAAGAVVYNHIRTVAAHGAAIGLRDFLKRPQIGDKQPILITYHVGQRFGGIHKGTHSAVGGDKIDGGGDVYIHALGSRGEDLRTLQGRHLDALSAGAIEPRSARF